MEAEGMLLSTMCCQTAKWLMKHLYVIVCLAYWMLYSCFYMPGYTLWTVLVHPVSITRFPLTRFSPGAGLLRSPFFHR